MSANKVIYNKENETFELFDNVLVIKDNNIQTQSDYAFVDLKKDSSTQNPMFLQEQSSKIWINSKTSNKEKEEIELDSSIISSCDCLDPVWSIRASSADYDTEAKWKEAVQKHELPWLHVYCPKGSTAIDGYAIQGFPTKILIGPDGKIVKTIVGEDPAFYKFLDDTFSK